MTLATQIHISDPVPAVPVFLVCRSIIGIPEDHPYSGSSDRMPDKLEHPAYIRSRPDGFMSALTVKHNWGEIIDDSLDGLDEADIEWYKGYPPRFVSVHLDTTYAAHEDGIGGCNAIHNHIISELADFLKMMGTLERRTINWSAHNEYNNTWHLNELPY